MIYVCSDIHAQGGKFQQFYQTLQPEDIVYVIGDVVDKGEDRVGPLLTIMNDSRFHMLIGNHEDMLLNYYHVRSLYKKSKLKYYRAYRNQEIQWLMYNDGRKTMEALDQLENVDEIVRWIANLPLVLNITVNSRQYILAHANPLDGNDLTYKDATLSQIRDVVWSRYRDGVYPEIEGKTIITGHSIKPELFYKGESLEKATFLDIDCGCALGEEGRLCVLCLDDLTYRYFK